MTFIIEGERQFIFALHRAALSAFGSRACFIEETFYLHYARAYHKQ